MESEAYSFTKENENLEEMNPAEILSWAVFETFKGKEIAVTSSFQSQSLPLLYLISKICPRLPVYFLDTSYHFPETIQYVEEIKRKLQLNVVTIKQLNRHPEETMYKTDPDMCCYLRKVEPLQRAFKGVDVWISGIRRDQTRNRKGARIIDLHEPLGVVKVSPMANVTSEIVNRMNEHLALPEHPLQALGYRSIGCMPCTSISRPGDDRSGRWFGREKTECGLHLNGK